VNGSGAGDGLEGDGAFLGDCGRVLAQDEFLRGRREVGETGDGEVLVVELGVLVESFVCLDALLVRGGGYETTENVPTCLTTGKTHGLALLSRYAPMPKSTFFGSVSLR
jgi:hypothetical protein